MSDPHYTVSNRWRENEDLEYNGGSPWRAGVYVRAFNPKTGKYVNADASELTKDSLLAWLRSRGGANEFAESLVCLLLAVK